MRCKYHPDRETIITCEVCRKPLCEECAISTGKGYLCSRCIAMDAAREAIDGIDKRSGDKKKKAKAFKEKKKLAKVLWRTLQWGIVGTGLFIMALHVPNLISDLKDDKPLRIGTYKTDPLTDECIRRLWQVARLLQENIKPGNDLVCPASGKPFIITEEENDVIARSPNPQLYGFSDMKVSSKRPVPEVIR